jgi:acyl-coenzyme A synthetase/AMP-(fatty) acid ligase
MHRRMLAARILRFDRRNVFAAGNDDVAQSAPGVARISPATNAPRYVVFAELPKTSTGKVQKFQLREMAKEV